MASERGEGTPVTLTYRALRGVFTAGLKGFYNTVEVRVLTAVSRRSISIFLGAGEPELSKKDWM